MRFIKVKTRTFHPPKDNIYDLFDNHLPKLKEGDILLITTKILSIHEGRCVIIKQDTLREKDRLALKEVNRYVPRGQAPFEYSFLTINHNILISSAGIDKSNGNGYYILWPKNPQKTVKIIWQYLRKKYRLNNLGVIAVDSNSAPLRYGTIGVAVAFYGIKPTKDYRGKKDVFGRKLKVTRANIVDSLATFGNLLMGESSEKTPMTIIRQAKFVTFSTKDEYKQIAVPIHWDMFYPLIRHMKKKK